MDARARAGSPSQALTVWDLGILKIYCVLFGAIVGAYTSSFVQRNVLWFVVAVLVLGGYHGYRWLSAAPQRD